MNETTGGRIKRISNVNNGISMSLTMKLWLSIALFSSHANPIRCPCGEVIDPFERLSPEAQVNMIEAKKEQCC
jgi:hypothetical protein